MTARAPVAQADEDLEVIRPTPAAKLSGGVMLAGGIFALFNGLFSPLALLVVPLNAIGSLLALVRLGPGRRADAARERLRDQGLEAGN